MVREHHVSAGEITALPAAVSVFILQRDQPSFIPGGQFSPQALGNRSSPQAICNPRQAAFEMRMHERQNSVSRCSEAQRKEIITPRVTPGTFSSAPSGSLEKLTPQTLFLKEVAFNNPFF